MLNLWRDVTGMPVITQVHVQKVFDAYYHSLKGKQVLVCSGLLNETSKLLENGDLDYLKEIDPTEYIYQIFYIWKQNEYLASELHDLTEQEKRKLNHRMIDDIKSKNMNKK